jgi:hypothetical protein
MKLKIDKIHYVRYVNIETIRDMILDQQVTDEDTVLLNRRDFDEVIIAYRDKYRVSIDIPFVLVGVPIIEDETLEVPRGRIGISRKSTPKPESNYEYMKRK